MLKLVAPKNGASNDSGSIVDGATFIKPSINCGNFNNATEKQLGTYFDFSYIDRPWNFRVICFLRASQNIV